MNELTTLMETSQSLENNALFEKKMSTKEIANILNVDISTIQKTALSLGINAERVGSSHQMMFNEMQVTAIKKELESHSKVNELSPKRR